MPKGSCGSFCSAVHNKFQIEFDDKGQSNNI